MKSLYNYAALCALAATSIAQLGAAPMFGIESIDLGGGPNSQAPTTLYRFDSTNGVFSGLSNIGVVSRGTTQLHSDGLAYSSTHGLFSFELSGAQSRLVELSTTNAQATTVGSYVNGDFRGAAFFGNNLLALDSATNRIVTVDINDGSILSSVNLMLGASAYNVGNSVDIAVRNGVVHVVEGGRPGINTGNSVSGTNFFSVNLMSGLLTLLKQDLINEPVVNQRIVAHGAAFEPGSSLLHVSEMNQGDGLFRYDVSTNYSRTGLVSEVVPGTNSGRGDLASDSSPVPEPATLGLMGVSCMVFALFMRRKA